MCSVPQPNTVGSAVYTQGRVFMLMRCILYIILQKKWPIGLNGCVKIKSLINPM